MWQIIDTCDQFDDEEWEAWLELELLMPANWTDPVLSRYLCAELKAKHPSSKQGMPSNRRRALRAPHAGPLAPPGDKERAPHHKIKRFRCWGKRWC